MSTPVPAALDRRSFIGRLATFVTATALLGRPKPSAAAIQGIEPFLGEILLFAGNQAPKGWAFCSGQLLPINQNQALFSLLGTTYGGNGQTTFALPDLRDRVPIHVGQGPGLTNRTPGERSGAATHTLTIGELPAHAHDVRASRAYGTVVSPTGMYPARNPAAIPQYGSVADAAMAPLAIGSAGGGQAHDNTQPYLGLNYIIALQGVFPS
jgi:microcystin-dependent protein